MVTYEHQTLCITYADHLAGMLEECVPEWPVECMKFPGETRMPCTMIVRGKYKRLSMAESTCKRSHAVVVMCMYYIKLTATF